METVAIAIQGICSKYCNKTKPRQQSSTAIYAAPVNVQAPIDSIGAPGRLWRYNKHFNAAGAQQYVPARHFGAKPVDSPVCKLE